LEGTGKRKKKVEKKGSFYRGTVLGENHTFSWGVMNDLFAKKGGKSRELELCHRAIERGRGGGSRAGPLNILTMWGVPMGVKK